MLNSSSGLYIPLQMWREVTSGNQSRSRMKLGCKMGANKDIQRRHDTRLPFPHSLVHNAEAWQCFNTVAFMLIHGENWHCELVLWPNIKPAKGLSHHTEWTRKYLPKVQITQKPCWQSLLVFLSPHCMSLSNFLQERKARKKVFWEQLKKLPHSPYIIILPSNLNPMFFLNSVFSTYLEGALQLFNSIFYSSILHLLALMFSFMKLPSCSSVPSTDQDAEFKAQLGMRSENVVQLIFAKNTLPIRII